jgi:hypothetical protein
MIHPCEVKSKQTVTEAIELRQRWINGLRKCYNTEQDLHAQCNHLIREHEQDIQQLKRTLAIANGEIV